MDSVAQISLKRVRDHASRSAAWRDGRLAILCLSIGMLGGAINRTDANWDLQNYHLYGPFAALNGRIGSDYFVAGFQGYLNPLANFPYYIAKFILFPSHPLLVAMLAGLPFGVLAFIVFKIAPKLLPEAGPVEAALAAILGMTGATTISEIGTTFDDIIIASILLMGFWAAVTERIGPARATALAGLATGCAAGLKFTAVLFVPGLLLFCMVQARDWRRAAVLPAPFGLGFILGFAASWGWWGVVLWRHFHNPFFPLFGSFFPSPWAPPVSSYDPRFLPRDIWQWLFYPFFWLQGRAYIVTEMRLRDPRFALVYLALAIRGCAMLLHKAPRPPRMVLALWVFFAVTYSLWLIGFSILRYIVALEVLSGVVIWTALRPMIKNRQMLILAVLCVACVLSTRPSRWGRIAYSASLVEAPIPAPPPGSLVFLQGMPLGFVVPYLYRPATVFISLDAPITVSAAAPAVRRRVADSRDIYVLTNLPSGPATLQAINARLGAFRLTYRELECLPVRSPVQAKIRICPAGHS